jgi:deoxyadenosine/deoxycytidine kinase
VWGGGQLKTMDPMKPTWWWQGRSVHLVGVSGIIGVGKSTAMRKLEDSGYLQSELSGVLRSNGAPQVTVEFVLEPVDEWVKQGYLAAFMDDPDTNALAFQMIVFNTHVAAVQRVLSKHYGTTDSTTLIVVVERTMFDQMLFWKTQEDMGRKSFTKLSDVAYSMIWNLRDQCIPRAALIFFLHTTTLEQTMERMRSRARDAETSGDINNGPQEDEDEEEGGGVTVAYQSKLLKKHRAWFTTPMAFPPECREGGIPCEHVNVDKPYHTSEEHLLTFANALANSIYNRVLHNHHQ